MLCFSFCNRVYIYFFQTSGPLLPIPLADHSMVRLGKGQAILGGQSDDFVYESKIYSMTCSNRNCIVSLLDRELSVPKALVVAIPIPDTISGCTTGGTKYFPKNQSSTPNIMSDSLKRIVTCIVIVPLL